MRRALLTAFILFAAPASAAEIPSCKDPGIVSPTPANNHAMTADDYPLLSTALNEQGLVALDLVIGPDGKVAEAKVEKSSGFARLDDAALAAAKARWLYTAPTQDGKPIACRWKADVKWALHGLDIGPGAIINVETMGPDDYPASARAAREEGVVGVVVAVDDNGKVLETKLSHSSGYADLDDASLLLARKWTVTPARLKGKPVKTAIAIAFEWSLDDAKP